MIINGISAPYYPNKLKPFHKLQNTPVLGYQRTFGNIAFSSLLKKRQIVYLKDANGNKIETTMIQNGHNFYLQDKDKTFLGEMHYSICTGGLAGDMTPDDYKNQKAIFLNSPLLSNKKYKGIGTELVRAAVEESLKSGCQGRVCLNASTINPKIGSPIPFYFKLGFKCTNSKTQAVIEDSIKNNKPIPSKYESATMFLPKDAIVKLLTKSVA